MSPVTSAPSQSVGPSGSRYGGGARTRRLLRELKLIYDPVKRMERSEQIRTAIALARLRFYAQIIILSSVFGLLLIGLAAVIGFPRILDIALLVFPPISLLAGVFLLNRIVHKEKEFKHVQWRKEAVISGDQELRRVLSLPFPVELKEWSASNLEDKLRQLEKKSGLDVRKIGDPEWLREEMIRREEMFMKTIQELLRHLDKIRESEAR